MHAHETLVDGADEWCSRVAAMPAHAFEMTKSLLRAAVDAPGDAAESLLRNSQP